MPKFYWKGINSSGTSLSGNRVAANIDELRIVLLSENIVLLNSRPGLSWRGIESIITSRRNLTAYEIATFFEQLSVLIGGGVELLAALNTIEAQSRNYNIKNIIDRIKDGVEQGKTLSGALSDCADIFDEFIIQMISIGQESGKLDLVLADLASHLKKNYDARKELLSSAAMPLFTLFFALVIIVAIFTVVVPQFQTFFNSLGKKIPSSTQRLIEISNFLRSRQLLFTILVLIFAGIGLFFVFGKAKTKRLIDYILLRCPFFSRLIILSNLAFFFQSLNLLLKSGIPLRDSILAAKSAVTNVCLRERLDQIVFELDTGKSLAESFHCLNGLYQCDILVSLIKVGERAGNLEIALEKICAFFNSELKRSMTLITSFFQPVLLVVVGIIVGIIIWVIYLPIINLAYSLG